MEKQQSMEAWGPNQSAFFDVVSNYIMAEIAIDDRAGRANQRMIAVLTGDIDELKGIPNEIVSEHDALKHEMFTGFLALFSLVTSTRSIEYYFRRYRFGGLPITMSEHLQNSCEMYFDRIGQFRDRLKLTLNAAKKLYPESDFDVGKIIKVYSKYFDWDIRQRNRVHHKGRYDDQYIDQLSMLQLMEIGSPRIKQLISSKGVHRTAVNVWVKKVRASSDAMANFMEQISEIMLKVVPPST